MTGRKLLKRNLLPAAVLLGYLIVARFAGVHCLVKALTHIPCPTCGVTRAMCALLVFDIPMYFRYNAMALPLVITAWLFLNVEIFPKKKVVYLSGYAVLAINSVYYLYRLLV